MFYPIFTLKSTKPIGRGVQCMCYVLVVGATKPPQMASDGNHDLIEQILLFAMNDILLVVNQNAQQ